MREDVPPDERGDQDHRHDRDERRAVALDLFANAQPTLVAVARLAILEAVAAVMLGIVPETVLVAVLAGAHQPPPPSAGPCDKGPLNSGTACVAHGTSGSYGGSCAG